MTSLNKSTVCFIIVSMMLTITGCAQKNAPVPVTSTDKKPYFAIISKGWQHQFWQAVKTGAFKAAKDYNVKITFEGPVGDFAVNQQIKMIEEAIKNSPDALIVAATDSKSIMPSLEIAQSKNIPIIAFDSGVEGNIPLTTVATDNKGAASLAADKLAKAIDFKGEVAVICHDDNSITGTYRKDGFVNRMKEKYPDIKVVAIKYGGGDYKISSDLVTEMILTYPKLKGIFATNEGSAIGMIDSVVSNKKEGTIILVGFDSGLEQKEAIRKGIMLGAVSQDPVMIGYKAVESAYLNYKGTPIKKEIFTDYLWYDVDNVNNAELQIILYD